MLGVSAYTVREWARNDEIPHLRLGHKTLRFRLSPVQAWIVERERSAR